MTTTGLAVQPIVGTHHAMYLGLRHQCLESRQIGIPQIVGIHLGVERMPVSFRSAMYRIVLGTSHCLQELRVISFQTTYHRHPHLGRQIRIFAISFLPASPAWIPENIHIGCPIRQSPITCSGLSRLQVFVEQSPSFRRDHIGSFLQSRLIERCR